MRFSILIPLFAITSVSIGCTTVHKHQAENQIAVAPTQVEIRFNENEVQTGDLVRAFEMKCGADRIIRGEPIPVCREIEKGRGEVTSVSESNRALVEMNPNTMVTSETRFEKIVAQ